MASRSSLSHWMMERSGMAAFSTGTSAGELALREHKAAHVLAQVARKALQLAAQVQPQRQRLSVGAAR